jgi:hypothetical protein
MASIRDFVEAGRTIAEIAEETGTTYDLVRHRLRRAGLKATHVKDATLAQRVADMKPTRAIEFLLDVIHLLQPTSDTEPHDIDGIAPNLTRQERRVVIAVYEARGATMPYEAILNTAYFDRPDELPDVPIIRVFLCKARAKNPALAQHLQTVWGVGVKWVAQPSSIGVAGSALHPHATPELEISKT